MSLMALGANGSHFFGCSSQIMVLMLIKMRISGCFTFYSLAISILMLMPGCGHGTCISCRGEETDTYHPMICTTMEWLHMDFEVSNPMGLMILVLFLHPLTLKILLSSMSKIKCLMVLIGMNLTLLTLSGITGTNMPPTRVTRTQLLTRFLRWILQICTMLLYPIFVAHFLTNRYKS